MRERRVTDRRVDMAGVHMGNPGLRQGGDRRKGTEEERARAIMKRADENEMEEIKAMRRLCFPAAAAAIERRDERERVPRDLEAEARVEAARIQDEEAQTIMEAAREVFGICVERVSEGDPPPPPPWDWGQRPEMKVGFHPFGDASFPWRTIVGILLAGATVAGFYIFRTGVS